MTKYEWISKCSARFVARAELDAESAQQLAEDCFENAGAGYFSDDPEGSADEKMSYWIPEPAIPA